MVASAARKKEWQKLVTQAGQWPVPACIRAGTWRDAEADQLLVAQSGGHDAVA